MNDLTFRRLSVPITTGTVRTPEKRPQTSKDAVTETGKSFYEALEEKLRDNQVSFSKHAVSRVMERGVDLTDGSLDRLNEGVRIAQEKGLEETLILVDRTAFIVNAKVSKVITTVNGDELKGNAFTNIDGAVIV